MDKDKKEMKIKIVKNGPYIVSGGVPLYQQVIVTDEAGHTKDLMDNFPVKEHWFAYLTWDDYTEHKNNFLKLKDYGYTS